MSEPARWLSGRDVRPLWLIYADGDRWLHVAGKSLPEVMLRSVTGYGDWMVGQRRSYQLNYPIVLIDLDHVRINDKVMRVTKWREFPDVDSAKAAAKLLG